jgi:thiamine pyrophosphate-dependent acetolactate synthase large subunit-like protein
VRKAFYRAKLESRPIMLSCPMDIQQKDLRGCGRRIQAVVSNVSRAAQVHPDSKALEQAADIVASSKKPVIVVGRGAQWAGAGRSRAEARRSRRRIDRERRCSCARGSTKANGTPAFRVPTARVLR